MNSEKPIFNDTRNPDPVYTQQCIRYKAKAKRCFTGRESTLSFVMLIFGYLYIRMVTNGSSHLGKTVYAFLIIAVSAAFLKALGRKIPRAAAVSATVSAVFGIAPFLCTSPSINFISVNAFQLSYIYFIYKCFDVSVEKSPGILFDFEMYKSVLIYPFSSFLSLFPALFSSNGKGGKKRKPERTVLYVILGLCLSVVPTIVVASLLSYDEAFSKLIGNIINLDIDIAGRISAIIFGIPVAMYLFGLWISSIDDKRPDINEAHCTKIRQKSRIIPQTLIFSAVTPVLAVYAVFFFSQISYFTSAFRGILPDGYSFSQYARSGFFELCAVTVINTVILTLIYLFAKRSQGEKSVGVTIYSAIICVSNIILISTAVSKMLLYIKTYGLTVLRVYTTWFMLTLALVFITFIVHSAVKKFRFVPAALSVVIIMTGAAVLSNVPAAVSQYNTNKILSGSEIVLDTNYFVQLGSSAVPDAVKLEKSANVSFETKNAATEFLNYYEKSLKYEKDSGVFSLNIPDILAKSALKER